MGRSSRQMLDDLKCELLESQSLAQFQERTEPLLLKLFLADHVAFCRMDPELPRLFDWRASTTGRFLQSYYKWYQDDFVFQCLSKHHNTAYTDTEMLRGRRLEDTVTFRHSRESHLRLRHVLAVLLVPEQQLGTGAVALYRDGLPRFREEDRRLLQALTRPLKGAFKNFARFGALSAHNLLLEELLRREQAKAIVLNAQRGDIFRTDAVTALLEKWYPGRSERDEWGIPRAWRARIDPLMAGDVLLTPSSDSWREQRGLSTLEVRFTRLPRSEGRDLWELQLEELNVIPEKWRPLLSERQFEAAALVLQRKSDKEIASEMRITEDTAKDHVHAAYRKLGVNSRTELMALAMQS